MKIVYETRRTITLTPPEERATTALIGVGAYVAKDVHAVAYLSSKGAWGAFAVRDESGKHTCQPGCGLKTELLGLARALERLKMDPAELTISVLAPKAADILNTVRNKGVVPLWDYTTLISSYAAQFERLKGFPWRIGAPTSPATEARKIAQYVHGHVTQCEAGTPLPRAISNSCNELAARILCRT